MFRGRRESVPTASSCSKAFSRTRSKSLSGDAAFDPDAGTSEDYEFIPVSDRLSEQDDERHLELLSEFDEVPERHSDLMSERISEEWQSASLPAPSAASPRTTSATRVSSGSLNQLPMISGASTPCSCASPMDEGYEECEPTGRLSK